MVSRVRLSLGGLFLAAATVAGVAASAATVSLEVERFGRRQLAAAQDARDAFLATPGIGNVRTEGFERFRAWNGRQGKTDPQRTAVGSFTAVGRHGSGHSVVSTGRATQVRRDVPMRWGRYNTDAAPGARKWLDSNDNAGIRWKVARVGPFNALAFLVTDAADVGGRFSITVDGTRFADLAGAGGRLRNGNILLVRILLDAPVERLRVVLRHDRTNDGFGIDGVAVGRTLQVAEAPVPPAALLLGSGLAAAGALRRRAAGRREAARPCPSDPGGGCRGPMGGHPQDS
jgi:hypothetical protein